MTAKPALRLAQLDGPPARTKVCAFRLTPDMAKRVDKALATMNRNHGVRMQRTYGPADFYRAAVLALLTDVEDCEFKLVTEWLNAAERE